MDITYSNLAVDQTALLKEIWVPFQNGQGWPVWDYVARQYIRSYQHGVDPVKVWESLPNQSPPSGSTGSYGLVWTADSRPLSLAPIPEEKVGLSIRGMQVLRSSIGQAGILADALAKTISTIANWEQQITPHVERAVSMDMPLDKYIPTWLEEAGSVNAPRTAEGYLMVLQKEVAPIDLIFNTNGQVWSVHLQMYLAPYLRIQNATDYLAVVDSQGAPRDRPLVARGLECAVAFDYLSLILSNHQAWGIGPFISVPDLRSAGVLALSVNNEAEFDRGLSAINSIVGSLTVPKLCSENLTKFQGKQPGTLTRLSQWIENNVEDNAGRANAESFIEDLRQVVRLRVDKQHSGNSLKKQAAFARRHLGLPEIILDWSDAWEIIRGRLRDALTAIALEVRMGATPSG